MIPFTRIQDLFDRLAAYAPVEYFQLFVEVLVIWAVVLMIVKFVQGTRAAGALKGVVLLLLLIFLMTIFSRILFGSQALPRLGFLFERLLPIVTIALVVIFQPELRRAAIRVGETQWIRSSPSEKDQVVTVICESSQYLSKGRFGAIICIQRTVGLQGLVEGGTILDAELSSRLLQTLFFPGSALHDLAVVIRGQKIHAAGVQLPMAEPGEMPDPTLGARHRAAVGLTRECDALVVVVSEETGNIRLSERGRLTQPLTIDRLREELTRRIRGEEE
ncbi:MAG: diadenylate cyclase [Phycisphaerales bacterium]|nr:diadenylate cyclase [Phycisphaerales bacterium]